MKKILLSILAIISMVYISNAQSDTSYWDKGGNFSLKAAQTSFTNWSQGGENSIAINSSLHLFANWKKGKQYWESAFFADLGSQKLGSRDFRKADDRIELVSKYGYKASENWNYAALFNFKTQFADGYKYNDNDSAIYTSTFLAPAYLSLSLGMDYKPNEYFSFFISPFSAKFTYVNDTALANAGAFGLEAAALDADGARMSSDKLRSEAGAFIKIAFEKDLMENVNLNTKVELFSNYFKNPQNIDVNWEVIFNLKVNDFLTAQIKTQLIYDDDIIITYDSNGDGLLDSKGPRTQFMEFFGIGFAYSF